jgi:hypothetical protein
LKRTNHRNNREDEQRNPSGSRPLYVEITGRTTADERAKEKQQEYAIARRTACWTMVTGIGTVIAAVLAGVAAWIFWNQLGTMQVQLTTQEADFRIDQRPILSIARNDTAEGHIDGLQYKEETQKVYWNYTIKNYGKGTAIDTRTCGYMSILGGKLVASAATMGPLVVPGQTYWGTVWYDTTIDPETMNKAYSADGGVIVKIILAYHDAYGTKYVVPNCLFRNANGSINWNDCSGNSPINLVTDKCESNHG